ncbi:hypothetical protein [Thalassomonas sp. RHCl1]|uniref:hypothetical protein n=1 Tax=Thalassomonas sp. RHCl1 TaxID=2995320 RepID=UPI00248CBFB0|nr:hypothetical protein [Thalassomonas sp. RHCl1]
MNQYDVVRIKEIISLPTFKVDSFNQRAPQVGDIATIVEIYSDPCLAYDLECSDGDGITIWLLAVTPDEMLFEVI